jgi:hypothetical protein
MRKMLDISYFYIMELYQQNKGPTDKEIPEAWLEVSEDEKEEIFDEIYESFLDEIFANDTKKASDYFVG